MISRAAAAIALCATAIACAGRAPLREPETVRVRDLGAVEVFGAGPPVRGFHVHPTLDVAARPTSAVHAHADTRSFEAARRALTAGRLPAPDDVLVESFALAAHGPAGAPDGATWLTRSKGRPGYALLVVRAAPGRVHHAWDPARFVRHRLLGFHGAPPTAADAARAASAPFVVVAWEVALTDGRHGELTGAPAPARRIAVAVALAEKLRGAYWARFTRYKDLLDALADLDGPEAAALAEMVARAAQIDDRDDPWARLVPLAESVDLHRLPELP